ncbi:MAG: DMT family transporter [Cyclobacteriaceae bacterium]|nr:DMT family transporter [Cyclobacteriaceae bacterium]
MQESNRGNAIVLLIILTLIWGTSFILIKLGLKVFAPNEVGALRVTAAGLFLLPAALVRIKELTKDHYWKLFLSGMMGIFIPAFLFATAQTRMDSSVAGMLNTLTPIFTLIVGSVIFKIKFRTLAVIGIMLGFVGAIVLMFARSGGELGSINVFALLIVIACIFYASNLNFIKYKITDLNALTITSTSVLLISPLAIVYLLAFTDFTTKLNTVDGAWKACGFVVLLGVMSTAIATFLFNRLVKISTPLFASSVTYLMPIVAVGWGLLDGESLGLGHFIGMAAVIAGVYLANRK